MELTDKVMTMSAKLLTHVSSLLLRTGRHRPGVRIHIRQRSDFATEHLRPLHALACRLMAEDFDHFRVHAETNDVVHEFRRTDNGELVGFQFWRAAPMVLSNCRAIVGGKLRIAPDFRGRSLHLLSGLQFYLQNQASHPQTRYYRLSIASLFGFVSITEALHDYQILDPHDHSPQGHAIMAAFQNLAGQSHYDIDPISGLIFVNIQMTPETIDNFGPSYFTRSTARTYIRHNPNYRSNGCYVGFWFCFTPANVRTLLRAITRKLWQKTIVHNDTGSGIHTLRARR